MIKAPLPLPRKALLLILVSFSVLFYSSKSAAQNVDSFDFGTDTSLEIVTWNLEWFPANGGQTLSYVTQFINYMDADIIAFQEIDNLNFFLQLADNLPQYAAAISGSSLQYLYKPESISLNTSYEIYEEANYWQPFPRAPFVMEFSYKDKNYVLINNHLKCCGDGILDLDDAYDQETRRFSAITYLKTYMEYFFQGENVIVVGDFNDELTDADPNNVFVGFLNEPYSYLFTDYELATSTPNNWSYPSWPSHLDHILITQPLFAAYENENSFTETLKLEDYLENGWTEYNQVVSDHRPVGLLLADANLDVSEVTQTSKSFYNSPNPVQNKTQFYLPEFNEPATLEIFTVNAKKLITKNILPGQERISLQLEQLKPGVYFARLQSKHNQYYHKIIVQ